MGTLLKKLNLLIHLNITNIVIFTKKIRSQKLFQKAKE